MKTFREYILTESKNLHMEHLEDSIFNSGSSGGINALKFAQSVVDMLDGNVSSSFNVTVKWDGAPAVFCGTNPDNGKFFVGTKSVFNKDNPKLNYTDADIVANHGHSKGLMTKLKIALANLKSLGIKDILQGDILFTNSDLVTQKIDGESHITFTPNTITYAVPEKSKLGSIINRAKIGVVFHTKYSGTSMENMSASFNPNIKSLKKSSKVWFIDANFKDTSGTSTFTKNEIKVIETMIENGGRNLGKIKKFLDNLSEDKKLIAKIKVYINKNVRVGSMNNTYQGLVDYIESEHTVSVSKLKTDAGRKRRQETHDQLMKYITKNKTNFILAFELFSLLNDIKIMIIQKMQTVKNIGTFIKKGDGFDVTAPEGFVAVDHISNSALKLVDRLEFSRNNFIAAKNWE
jgi:hypothetical protein